MAGTVLVTGGTGFVAGWCIVELLQRGYTVRTTVRSLSKEPGVRATVASPAGSGDLLTFFPADLTKDEGWDAAVLGCDYVLHVASPLGGVALRDPESLIAPAREGTLRVLRASVSAGVRRVVMTSSTAAATPPPQNAEDVSDEAIWTDPTDRNLSAYRKSKVLAERAAWDFMNGNTGQTTLTTILPSAVFGPVLTMENLGSVRFIERLLAGRPPGIPGAGFCIVDVRDLADLHLRAMTSPEAAGERFIASGDFLWMREIASTLRSTLGEKASKVPTRPLPNSLLRVISWFVPSLKVLTPLLGRRLRFSSAKAGRILGFSPRPATATIVDCAESLLSRGWSPDGRSGSAT